MDIHQARLLILASDDGVTGWKPLKESEVPDWVKDPEVMGSMVDGNMAQNPAEVGGKWYLAIRCDEATLIREAPAPKLVHSDKALAIFHDAEGRN